MRERYDVMVIGGGLVGCWTAWRLARKGMSVAVVEEHRRVGEPRHCTGVIGAEAFKRLDLPEDTIQQPLHSAVFVSPLGTRLRVARPQPQAYVVDRTMFDRALSDRAVSAGAELFLGTRCSDLTVSGDSVTARLSMETAETDLRASVAVLATGCNYRFHQRLGLDRPRSFLDCTQSEVEAHGFHDVELYFGREVAPGSFGWAVPVGPSRVRLGVSTERGSEEYFWKFIGRPEIRGRLVHPPETIQKRAIPVGTVRRSTAERVLVIGDGAGQVKPTTGGGIYYGLLCSDLAIGTIQEAFDRQDFSARRLRSYDRAWRKAIGWELAVGRLARRILSRCSDAQIEALMRWADQEELRRIIHDRADFDWHHGLILRLIRFPAMWKRLGLASWDLRQGAIST